jgi:HlyD family secretion protein
MNRRALLTILAVAAVAAGAWWLQGEDEDEAPRYRTAEVEHGDLVVSVTASGTVQPTTQVQVGTQVSGAIQALYADFNSAVTKGQVVAQLDPATYQARLESDRANLIRAEADVMRVQALLKQAENEARRMTDLIASDLVTASEFDQSIANRDSLLAQIKVAEATVKQQRAALAVSEVNLQYCTIESPIDGIVVARSVDVGQTVAASLSAPTLFIIAADLEKMQVQAAVTEADIGRLQNGQPVSFTADAYPGETFHGTVSQVRLAPTIVQNVVTYTVLVDAANPGGRLLPGMTADLQFELDRRDDVLLVPDAALRFSPEDALAAGGEGHGPYGEGSSRGESGSRGESRGGRGESDGSRGESNGSRGESDGSRGEGGARWSREGKGDAVTQVVDRADGAVVAVDGGAGDAGDAEAVDESNEAPPEEPVEQPGRVWISTPMGPKAVDVVVAQSDGLRTAVVSGDLREGDEVITGIITAPAATAATNPFAPAPMGRPGRSR